MNSWIGNARGQILNRLDDVIMFRLFTKPDLIQILTLEADKVVERLRHKNIRLELDDKAKDFLVEKAFRHNFESILPRVMQ